MGERPRRRRVEARLDRLVRANRVTLAVTVPAVGAVLLVAASRGLLPAAIVLHPALLLAAVAAMRLPLLAGVLPVLDRRGALGLLALSAFAYGVEFVGVTTGLPYGAFRYTTDLGPMLGGHVPLSLPLLYLPLVVNAYLLALAVLGPRADRRAVRVGAGVAALLLVDLVLDPGAVAVGFWAYDAGGPYYDVPASNYAGWLLTGSVAVWAVDRSLDRGALRERFASAPYLLDDLVSFLVLWGGINLAAGHWLAVFVAGGLAAAVAVAGGTVDRLGPWRAVRRAAR